MEEKTNNLSFGDLFDLVLSTFDDSEGIKHVWIADMKKSINHPRKSEIIQWLIDSEDSPYISDKGTLVYESIWKKDFKVFYERLTKCSQT